MAGVGLGLHTITNAAHRERVAIEAQLTLGGSRTQAFRMVSRFSLRTAMIPIINSMTATGLISLPGMMTAQILSDLDRTEAGTYQLLISFLIAGGTSIDGAWLLSDGHQPPAARLAAPTPGLTGFRSVLSWLGVSGFPASGLQAATFQHQEIDHALHRGIIGPAN